MIALCWLSPVQARTPAVREIAQAEFSWAQTATAPAGGWRAESLPFTEFFLVPTQENAGWDVRWARFSFARADFPSGQLAMTASYTSERFTVFLNGRRIYRNYIDKSERTFANFGPAYIDLPADSLNPGRNEVAIRLESDEISALGLGRVHLGDVGAVKSVYDRNHLLQFDLPRLINAILAALTLGIFLFWLKRPKEQASFWLALTGLIWCLRNVHYSAVAPPGGSFWMWEIAVNALFLIQAVYFAYLAHFFELPRRRLWIGAFFVVGVGMVLLRQALLAAGLPDLPAFLVLLVVTTSIPCMTCFLVWRNPSLINLAVLTGSFFGIAFPVHDFGMLAAVWQGAGFALMPYASLIVFAAFILALGGRVLSALDITENLNATLAVRVDEVKEQLANSEASRQALAVNQALVEERIRLMGELHDRIGSSLISAIAVTEHQGAPPVVAQRLRRSLQDMKLAVDSLDDFGGNPAFLLGTFRNRLEPDLLAAGVRFDWRVAEVGEIEWLDAINALHVLRMMQEAVSNTLSHSGATTISIGCTEMEIEGQNGVAISYADNGCGYDPGVAGGGHGLQAIRSRAEAIGARLLWRRAECVEMTIFLPFIR